MLIFSNTGRRGSPGGPNFIQRTKDRKEKVERESFPGKNIPIGYPTGDGQS